MQSIKSVPIRGLRAQPKRGSHHGAFGIIVGDYCTELKDVLSVAKSKGYDTPTKFQLLMIDFLLKELKASGVFRLYDCLYVSGLNSSKSQISRSTNSEFINDPYNPNTLIAFSTINIKNPLQFNCTIINGGDNRLPLYTARGIKSVSLTGNPGLDTGYVPKDLTGANWTQNNAGFFCYVADNDNKSTTNMLVAGSRDTVNNRSYLAFAPNFGGQITGQINVTTGGVSNFGAITNSNGFFRLERTASNLTTCYLNSVSTGTNAGASSTLLATTSMYILARNIDGAVSNTWRNNPISFIGFGASLGSTLQKIEYEIFTQFRTKLGYQ